MFTPVIRIQDENTIVYFPSVTFGKGRLYRAEHRSWVKTFHYGRLIILLSLVFYSGFDTSLFLWLIPVAFLFDFLVVRLVRWRVVGYVPALSTSEGLLEQARSIPPWGIPAIGVTCLIASGITLAALISGFMNGDREAIAAGLLWLAFMAWLAWMLYQIWKLQSELRKGR